jgi:NtrC-family two-component system sensor histidine kinase KinB
MLSLRYRIALTLLPQLALLAVLGGAGVFILHNLSQRIDRILRENYDSVLFMQHLDEALERIDSSFPFALAGRENEARKQYEVNWPIYEDNLRKEENNITLPGEGEAVRELRDLSNKYRAKAEGFYKRPPADAQRPNDYFGSDGEHGKADPNNEGLLGLFKRIKGVSGKILAINQTNMEQESKDARETARISVIGFGIGLGIATVLSVLLAWQTTRAILQPVREVTESALAIGRGNLDQVVPVQSHDEVGQLADAFNTMARQLRHYRQTDYSRLLRAQRTSQATIDSFPDPVLVIDLEDHVEMANPAAQRLLGVAGSEGTAAALAWRPPEALREPLRAAIQDQRPYLPEGFERVVSFTVEAREEAFLPRILPISDPYGNTLGAAVLLENVTRFRLLDQIKSDLVATVSHEVKTPLTSIRLALHFLLEETIGPLNPKQLEMLVDARDNAERLLGMVNRLLDLARLEGGQSPLDLKPEEPATLLLAAADTIRPRAEAKEVTVKVDVPPDLPPVSVDAGRFGHALNNLLDNALTYTDPGGQVTLTAAATGDTVTLTVADTGLGIPPEHLPHVFDKFFRIPGQSSETGTGLGLAIVREIVTSHGGTITCTSTVGAGTVFNIALPIWSNPTTAAATPNPGISPTPGGA